MWAIMLVDADAYTPLTTMVNIFRHYEYTTNLNNY